MEKSFKGERISKKFSRFLSLGKENVIGYKNKTVTEKKVVVQIWGKVCRKHKNELRSSVKEAEIQSFKDYTCG